MEPSPAKLLACLTGEIGNPDQWGRGGTGQNTRAVDKGGLEAAVDFKE